jgi:3-hydroxyisobutyrate dehydrogenase-like beta-hydroxyacid dehydrogenase
MPVGFIGAGRMGAPMVRRLVDAGHHVRALGRTDERRLAVTELGAEAVDEIAGAASDADVVVVCVFTDEQVRQTCVDDGLLAAMRPGSVVVLHTTASPNTDRGGPTGEAGEQHAVRGADRASPRWSASASARTWPSSAKRSRNSAPTWVFLDAVVNAAIPHTAK